MAKTKHCTWDLTWDFLLQRCGACAESHPSTLTNALQITLCSNVAFSALESQASLRACNGSIVQERIVHCLPVRQRLQLPYTSDFLPNPDMTSNLSQ